MFNKIIICLLSIFFISFVYAKDNDTHKKASLFGKYKNLIQTIKCKKKGNRLKEFTRYNYKAYGYFKGGKWCDNIKGKAGFYSYLAPKWYVWMAQSKKSNKKTTSVNNKYVKLIQKMKCNWHKKFYKQFAEYGFQPKNAWCGKKVKPGFYVYVYPYWYIWKKTNSLNFPKEAKDYKNYEYTYSKLLQIIDCPKDTKEYGPFYEYGKWGWNRNYCGVNTKNGFWVYSHSKWYVWEKREKKVWNEGDKRDDWPPK